MTGQPRVALISAVTAAMRPAAQAISERIPEAETWNLLDDRLLSDAEASGGLTEDLKARMDRLIQHALVERADAVLLTCSLYSSVAQNTSAPVPVLGPDESAFAEIAAANDSSVLVVASFDSARDDTMARLQAVLDGAEVRTKVFGVSAPAAMAATKVGDQAALVATLREALEGHLDDVDTVFLAQYSLAPAGEELARIFGVKVFSGPASAAKAIHAALTPKDASS
jgi:hypothetical protein